MMKSLNRLAASMVLCVAAFHAEPGSAQVPRGVWWWTGTGDRWGSAGIVGEAEKEQAALEEFQRWQIGRVYGSYGSRPVDEPGVIASWNEKLHAAGLESQLLLSENTWIFTNARPSLLTNHLSNRLILFNAAQTNAAARFDAVHLDIEPQALTEWKTNTATGKRDLLRLLLDTFRAARLCLDTNGAAALPIYADVPVYWDGVSIGWDDDAERDQWFDDLGATLAGVTFMAYERSTLSGITNSVEWECGRLTNETRIGLDSDVGAGATWATFDALTSMVSQVESATAFQRGVDIHSFSSFESVQPLEIPFLVSPLDSNAWFAVTNLSLGASNRVECCTNLVIGAWDEVDSFFSWGHSTNWDVPVSAGTWRYYRIKSAH